MSADPIDAVAAVIREDVIGASSDDTTAHTIFIATIRALAEAGWLRTAEDRRTIEGAQRLADGEDDLSDCPYFRRGLPGADPRGTCSYGCRDEPSCMTDVPRGGWPLEHLRAAGGSAPAVTLEDDSALRTRLTAGDE